MGGDEPLLPTLPIDEHPLGCHRTRVPDRVCFEGILIRLVTGCAWVDAERLVGPAGSDTTRRARRDEWLAAGVFDAVATEALAPMTASSASTSAIVPSTAASTRLLSAVKAQAPAPLTGADG